MKWKRLPSSIHDRSKPRPWHLMRATEPISACGIIRASSPGETINLDTTPPSPVCRVCERAAALDRREAGRT